MNVEFRLVGPSDEPLLADIFAEIDESFFRPHPFTAGEAHVIATSDGPDLSALLVADGRAVAYGMLRGWSEGYLVPSLGVGVRSSEQGRGFGRAMMGHLHVEARRRGATVVRLRVHPENVRARHLYEVLGYVYAGMDRGELVMLLDIAEEDQGSVAPRPAPLLTGSLLDAGAPAWGEVLRTARHDFYHLPAYVELCAAHEGGRACALHVTDGQRTMLLPLLVRSIPGGGLDATSPYGYPGPIGPGTDDPAFLRLALVAGQQVMRDVGLVSVFVRLHPLLNQVVPNGVGVVVPHGETVSVDLALAPETIWMQTRANHRRDIVRASRLGYIARMDEDWSHLETFKRLYRDTMERRAASAFYFFPDEYFAGLRRALAGSLHVCVVEREGTVVAAGLFVEADGIVEYHLSGTDPAFRDAQPTKLMLHYVGAWARERGNAVLHLGGGVGGGQDSLMLFKSGFSPRRNTYSTLRMVIDEVEYKRLVEAQHPHADPRMRSGYFPLYRQD